MMREVAERASESLCWAARDGNCAEWNPSWSTTTTRAPRVHGWPVPHKGVNVTLRQDSAEQQALRAEARARDAHVDRPARCRLETGLLFHAPATHPTFDTPP